MQQGYVIYLCYLTILLICKAFTVLVSSQDLGMQDDLSEDDMMRRAIALSLGENITEVRVFM